MADNVLTDGEKVAVDNDFDYRTYEIGVMNRQNEIANLLEQKSRDEELLSGYVLKNLGAADSEYGIVDTLKDVVTKIEEAKNGLQDELENKWVSTLSSAAREYQKGTASAYDQLFSLLDPIIDGVKTLQDSVLTKMGISEIPVIGNIQSLFVGIADAGRVISRVPEELRTKARRDAEAKTGEDDNIFYRLFNELMEILDKALEILYKILAAIQPFLIIMLLDKLKPVIDTFSLAVGEIVGIAEVCEDVFKALLFNSAKILDLFVKALEEKLGEVWDVIRYVIHGGDLPADAMISGVVLDIVSCDFDISAKQLDSDLISENLAAYDKKQVLKRHLEKNSQGGNSVFNSIAGGMLGGIAPAFSFGLDSKTSSILSSIQFTEKQIAEKSKQIDSFTKSFKESFDATVERKTTDALVGRNMFNVDSGEYGDYGLEQAESEETDASA